MSNSNKTNRKIILAKRFSNTGFNYDAGQGSKHESPLLENASTSLKRSHDGNKSSDPREQPSAKQTKITNDHQYRSPFVLSPPSSSSLLSPSLLPPSSILSPSSSTKNIAHKRLQDLRRSLEQKRSTVEREVNERLNKTMSSEIFNTSAYKNIFNSSSTANNATRDVSLPGTSSSSSIQSRLNVHKSLVDLQNNNSTVTSANMNALNEKVVIDDNVQMTNETERPSSRFRFLPTNDFSFDRSTSMDDSMEWEPVDEDTVLNNINKIRKEISYDKKLPIDDILNNSDPLTASQNGVFIVIDTNIFLSQMNVLVQLRKKEFKDFNRVTIIVPWMVLQELDYMKETKGCHLAKNARKAVSYINEQLVLNDPYFKGQTVLEASRQEMSSNNADDGILSCCMQLVADKKFVILLSNDINLRNKVLVNKIQAYNSADIMDHLSMLQFSDFNDTNKVNVDKVKIILSNLLTHIVESEMRKAYGDIWLKMVKSNPPFTMDEALNVMHKYWVSVFSFSLQKQAHQKIEEFISFSKRHKNAISYSRETYKKFMEHSLTLCVYLKNGYPCYKFVIVDSLSNIQKCGQ